jgi:hypothetical protein
MMAGPQPGGRNPAAAHGRHGCLVIADAALHAAAQSFPTERLSLRVLIRPAADRWGDFLSPPYDRTSVQIERATEHFSVRVLGKGGVRSAD